MVMLPPSINVPVLSSVVVTLYVVDVIVAVSDVTTAAVLVVFATTSMVDKLDRVIVLLLDIVDVGAIGAPSDDIISVVLSMLVLSSILVSVAIVAVVPLLFAGFRDVV